MDATSAALWGKPAILASPAIEGCKRMPAIKCPRAMAIALGLCDPRLRARRLQSFFILRRSRCFEEMPGFVGGKCEGCVHIPFISALCATNEKHTVANDIKSAVYNHFVCRILQ
jgi:hypothetical protein